MRKYGFIILCLIASLCFAEEVAVDTLQVSPKITFMEFGSTTCIPCVQMEAVLEQIEAEYGDLVEVIFTNVKKDREKSKEYKIRLIPTQIIFDENGKELLRHQGYFPFKEVKQLFKQNGVLPTNEATQTPVEE